MHHDPWMRLQLIKRDITLGEALEDANNVLRALNYPQKKTQLLCASLDHFDTHPLRLLRIS